MFNPLIVGELFAEQASPWRNLIAEHHKQIHKAATTFVELAIEAIVPVSVARPLWDLVFTPFLGGQDNELQHKL